MVINFVILFGALIFFAGKSTKKKFKDRAAGIQEDLARADEAAGKAEEYLASVAQVDTLAQERRDALFADADKMIAKNTEESVRKCEEEKESILQDAEDVKELMSAGMHGRVYSDAIVQLTDTAEAFLKNDKFGDARKKLQSRFLDDVSALVKPTRSDLVNLDEKEKVEVVVSGNEEVDQDTMNRIHGIVAGNFLDCQFETVPDLGDDLQIQFGDRLYKGTLDDILDAIESDSLDAQMNSASAGRPIDLTLMTSEMKDEDVEALKKIISGNFINYDFETDKNQTDEIELQFGDKVYRGNFDKVLEQIGADMA